MPNNPNANANIEPYQIKKGEVKNPKGRGKGNLNFNTLVKNLLEDDQLVKKITKGRRKPQWLVNAGSKRMVDALMVAMMVKGLQGDVNAVKYVMSKAYGEEFEPEGETDVTYVVTTFATRKDKDG